jgi:hypothetical protein
MTTDQEAIRRLFKVAVDNTSNLPPLPGIYPDYSALIVRNSVAGRELGHVTLGNADAAEVSGWEEVRSGRHQPA